MIQYSVVLFPLKTAGFETDSKSILAEEPVEIVTAFAPGPRPRSHAPPGYETEIAMLPSGPEIGRSTLPYVLDQEFAFPPA